VRIGLIAPPWIPVPPPGYGGTEAIVDYLARGLRGRGHDVRLFTVGESTCPVPRAHFYPRVVQPIGGLVPEMAQALAAYDALTDVDVIHDHTMIGPLISAARGGATPVVTTIHGPFTAENRLIFKEISRHATVVAISHAQARDAAMPDATVIHHGVDTTLYRYGPGGGGFLLFIGRMTADKGVHRAVRVARRAGRRLVIVAKMREPSERAYFERKVAPFLADRDEVLIEAPLPERVDLLGRADALINPIGWPEPFGLVMAEALACGTPVLAHPHGAAPEIVDHGHTGYLCADEDGMVAAVDRVLHINRADCRAAAVTRFSLHRMTADYESLFRRAATDDPARQLTAAA
jgi:glycosyltransferase involved in cell wall biosynthesis